MSAPLSPGLATVGTTQAESCFCHSGPSAAKLRLQLHTYAATTSARATVSAVLHLWLMSLSSSPHPVTPAHSDIPTFRGLNEWVSYSCPTWCSFKVRNQGVFSLHHDAYIARRQCIFIFCNKVFFILLLIFHVLLCPFLM